MKMHPLKKWRLARKLSLKAAARLVAIADVTWASWEKGDLPQMRLVPRITKLTGIRAEDFL